MSAKQVANVPFHVPRPHHAPALLCAALLCGASATGFAQSSGAFPAKPIRMIVGFAPGGPADITARTITPKMSEVLGQPIIIENRGGAGGTIGTEVVARSLVDGYTILLGSQSSFVFAPWLYKKLGYDPIKDLTPISTAALTPYLLAINPRVPAKTVADLVRLGKGKANFLSFGSSGSGATSHIGGELLAGATGLSLLHVPFKGTGPSIAAVVGGEIDMMIADVAPMLVHERAGRLRILATVGAKRTPAAPDAPTLIESGFKVPPLAGRFGVLGPAGLPKDVVSRLHDSVVQTVRTPEVRQRFASLGYEPVGDTPEEYARTIREELEVFGKVIQKAGISGS